MCKSSLVAAGCEQAGDPLNMDILIIMGKLHRISEWLHRVSTYDFLCCALLIRLATFGN
jgi:hypothetical protein